MDDHLAPEALTSINALLRHMEEEATLFQRLAALLDRQREALKRVGAPGLGEVRAETEALLAAMDQVGEARNASLAEVGSHLGVAADAGSGARRTALQGSDAFIVIPVRRFQVRRIPCSASDSVP